MSRTLKEILVGALCMTALALLIAFASPSAVAQQVVSLPEPACRPTPAGTGTYAKHGQVAGVGRWHYWWCPGQFEWRLEVVYELDGYRLVHPDTTGMTLAQTFSAYWQANATIPPTDPRAKPLYDAARAEAAEAPPAPPRWIVTRNGTYTTRPAYPFTDGVRGMTSTARATVGADCDTRQRSVEGSVVYAGVGAGLVAACTRVP